MRQVLVLVIVLGLLHSGVLADDFSANWHQWRGPHSDGSSATANPPIEWSPTKNVKWNVAYSLAIAVSSVLTATPSSLECSE